MGKEGKGLLQEVGVLTAPMVEVGHLTKYLDPLHLNLAIRCQKQGDLRVGEALNPGLCGQFLVQLTGELLSFHPVPADAA